MADEATVLALIRSLHAAMDGLADVHSDVVEAMRDVHAAVELIIADGAAMGEAVAALQSQPGPTGEGPQDVMDDTVRLLHDFDQSVSAFDERIEELSGHVVEATSAACNWFTDASDAADAALQQLNEGIDASVQQIAEEGESLNQASDALAQRIDDVHFRIDEMLDSLEERVDAAVTRPATEMLQRCSEAFGELGNRVIEEVMPTEVERIAENLATEIKQALDEALAVLCDGLDAFAEQIAGCSDSGNETRAVIQPALDQLRGAIDPVLAELDRIRGLAGSVGIAI